MFFDIERGFSDGITVIDKQPISQLTMDKDRVLYECTI